MNETETFADTISAEDGMEERKAIASILPIFELRDIEKRLKKGMSEHDASTSNYAAMSPLRRWLTDHPDERLTDGENNLVAYLQSRSGGTAYADALEIRAKDAALFEKLATLGILQIDTRRMTDARQRGVITGGELASWEHPVDGTPALRIEVVKDS